MEDNLVFLPHNVPSLKNSKIATSRGVFSSKTVGKYLRKYGIKHYSSSRKTVEGYKTSPMTFPVEELRKLFEGVVYPTTVGFHFVRDSKRSFDFNNANQIVFDLLTAFDIIPDDSMNYVVPACVWINDLPYSVDPKNAGVYIKIINQNN
jgi:hypothetical protein